MGRSKPGYLRPTNLRSPSAREFWRGLSERKLLSRTCRDCGARFFPPRALCPECLGASLEWAEESGRGTLHSWTEVHLASPDFDTPFLLGLVDLEDGRGRLAAEIVGAEPSDLTIGMPVRIGFRRVADDLTLYSIELQ